VLDAFALAIVATGGLAPLPGLAVAAPDMSLAHRDAQAIDRANAELLKVAPTGASYVSESNYFNPNWSHACWGENYARLRTIKDKYVKRRRTGTPYRRRRGTPLALWFAVERRRSA
jgi:hypothetical protein